jgi:hypothetical protein
VPTFRDKKSRTCLTLKMGPIGCSERSTHNYPFPLRNITEQCRSHHLMSPEEWYLTFRRHNVLSKQRRPIAQQHGFKSLKTWILRNNTVTPSNLVNMLMMTPHAANPNFRTGGMVYKMKLLEFTISGLFSRLGSLLLHSNVRYQRQPADNEFSFDNTVLHFNSWWAAIAQSV